MGVTPEGRALGKFRSLRSQVADLNDRIARVQAHMNRLVAQRDRKHAQIPLTDRERIAWQRKIDVAAGTIAGLEAERRALLS